MSAYVSVQVFDAIGELYYVVPETQAETKLSMRATTLTVNWNWTNFCMLM